MKREGGGEGFKVMKKGHEEKSMSPNACGDVKYAKYGMDNEKELKENTQALASYVKKNKMKY